MTNGFEFGRRSNLEYDITKDAIQNGERVMVGKVVAHIDGCSNDALDIIYRICRNSGNHIEVYNFERYDLANHYRGKSKCNFSRGDEFDVDFGRGLAKERCLAKYHKQLNKKLKLFLQDMREVVARTERYLEQHNINYSDVQTIDDMKTKKFS